MTRSTANQSQGAATKNYLRIIEHYEDCLARHGDTHLGVDWPNAADARLRYQVMLELVLGHRDAGGSPVGLLDFGCGAGHLLEFIRSQKIAGINYHGVDLSERFVALCRGKFPGVPFSLLDVLADDAALPTFDYVIANGVFTEKRELTFDEMMSYFEAIVRRLWSATRCGIAFNVMSVNVDWQRDTLFHVPLDRLTAFVTSKISRHMVVRMDYGLREYTVYVYRQPNK
jgi:SAM-dependent methyltransferase